MPVVSRRAASKGSSSPGAATPAPRAACGSSKPATRCPIPPVSRGTAETLALADSAGPGDLVLVLVSGGASANWVAPATGVSLAEKQAVTRSLLACGASIFEINTVRKHLSRIKGGRLAERAHPARLVTLGISDVPGDDPAVIGSGPTVPDPTTLADAREIVARYDLELPSAVTRRLQSQPTRRRSPGIQSLPGHLLSWPCGPQTFFLPSRMPCARAASSNSARQRH